MASMEWRFQPTIQTVAVVGAGVIGRSWIRVFARAGCHTRVFDRDEAQVEKALKWVDDDLAADRAAGVITADEAKEQRARISVHGTLGEALQGAGYAQESGPEAIELKKLLYAVLDQTADAGTILGSSTSAHDMTEIAAGLTGASRCIVAHPVNPPHLIPVVEVLPGKQTDPAVTARVREFLTSVGQKPVLMNFYVRAFLLNRMQAALLKEAISLVESGVADVDAVDTVIRDGLGLRWALMGPFGVADTNSDGGVREYFTLYRQAWVDCMDELGATPSFSPELIEQLGSETDAMLRHAPREKVRAWRDRMIRSIRALKTADPGPHAILRPAEAEGTPTLQSEHASPSTRLSMTRSNAENEGTE